MVRFKSPQGQKQFTEALHPATRDLVNEFDAWATKNGLPDTVVTSVVRTLAENRAIYKGVDRFSWHLCRCAVDLRNHHYTPEQKKQAEAWLAVRCERPRWEFVPQDHGTGPHFHIAIRDFRWRTLYTPAPEKKP